MTAPHRVRLSRKKGWRMPPNTVKVDRTTVFGNPFHAGEQNGLGWGEIRDAEHAVWLYRHWLTTPARSIVLERLPALAGRNLACWCVAGAHCHADVLLDLANLPNIDGLTRALLDGPPRGRTPLELATASAQLMRATGHEPTDAEQIGSALAALRSRAAQVPP